MDLTSSKYAPEKGLAIVLSAVTPDVTAADGCLSYDRQKPREGTLVARETQQGTGEPGSQTPTLLNFPLLPVFF